MDNQDLDYVLSGITAIVLHEIHKKKENYLVDNNSRVGIPAFYRLLQEVL